MVIGKYNFFCSILCYLLTMNNCVKLHKGSNKGVYCIYPHFQAIKEGIFAFTVDKCFKYVFGRW